MTQTNSFANWTDAQLRDRERRLEYLANTSEDTDEYCRLLAKQQQVWAEIAARTQE